MLGAARPDGEGPAHVEVSGRAVVVRGVAPRVEGGELHGEFDLSEPGMVRLTLYDSLPGRPVDEAPPPGIGSRSVRFEARIAPLPAGAYEVVVGHYDPREHLVVVRDAPVHVRVSNGE